MALPTLQINQATILVAEDNAVNQYLITEALRNAGFQNLLSAENGYEALEQLEENAVDLVITDLLMPDMDGFELCREIRAHPTLREIPILALTAVEDEKMRLSVLEMGASDLVRKPVTPAELIARCRLQLENRFMLKDLHDYQQQIEEDLHNARAMQNLLMPDPAAIQQIERHYGLTTASLFLPSSTIGGDFWGVKPLDGGRIAFYLGDFTGHGVTAAINVFRLSALLDRLPIDTLKKPARCLQQLNEQLHAMLPIQLFATFFYGVLDIRNEQLAYSIGGCPPPLKISASGEFELLHGTGLPLAATARPHYEEHRCAFLSQDALLLYSDALIETPDLNDAYLQIADIGRHLANCPPEKRTAPNYLTELLDHFTDFTANPITDDLTLSICMRSDRASP